jgi:hypothetical protein
MKPRCASCKGRGWVSYDYEREACPECGGWSPRDEAEWFCRSLFGMKCTETEDDGRDHDKCGYEPVLKGSADV